MLDIIMKQLMFIAAALSVLVPWVNSQCIPGLMVRNATDVVLSGCNQLIDSRALRDPPLISYAKAKPNDTYLLMLLRPLNHDMYYLHWLLTGVKYDRLTGYLQTHGIVKDLIPGYLPPTNFSRYELRLYNMTGLFIWDHINPNEKNFFLPSQWLAKYGVHPSVLAQTVFNVTAFVPPISFGQAPSSGFMPMPAGGHPYPKPEYLPAYPSNPAPQQPPQGYPPSHQPVPIYPSQQPYPNQVYPQPQPHPTRNNFQGYPGNNVLLTPTQYNINGTIFRLSTPETVRNNILEINSTKYSSEFFKKRYTLSPYLIINNKSYIWRNQTHVPGRGPSVYINGTQYVPYNPPSNEIHHYHYHKGSASSTTPTILLFTIFVPLLYSVSRS